MQEPSAGLVVSRRIQRVVVAVVAVVLAGACTDSTDTVATDSIATTTASSTTEPTTTTTTSSNGPLPTSTETTAEDSSAATSTSGVGEIHPSGEIDAAIQEWVDSYCASAQDLGTTLGPDDVGETRPVWPEKAEAARNLSARYEELARVINSDLELTIGEFRDRSERSAHDLHAAADDYMALAAAIDDEPVGGELEALIDHHHDVELDALEAAGLFLLTPLQRGYDVSFEFTVPVEVTDPAEGEGSSPGVTSRLGAGEGCPFILQYSIPNCSDEPAACSPSE